MPPIVKLRLQLCVCISWPSFSSYQGNWAKFTIDNWVAESADAAAAEQAAQFGGIVRFQSNTSNPSPGHALLDCGDHPAHANQLLAAPPCAVSKMSNSVTFWGLGVERQCHCISCFSAMTLLTPLHWSELSLVHSIGFSLLDIALQFIVWQALYLTPPGHPSIPSRSTYSTMVLHPSYSRYLNPFEIGQNGVLCAIACTAKIPLTPLGAIKQISLRSGEFAQCTL